MAVTLPNTGSAASETPKLTQSHSVWQSLTIVLEMIKFSHTIFALPFAFLAALLAATRNWQQTGHWRWSDFVLILLCMVCARSAAMAFNRWADWRLDAQNPRTVGRALPAGQITGSAVLWFILLTSLAFIGTTALFWWTAANPWPLRLSLPVLLWLGGYSYAKRFTSLAHVWLGVALALSPIAAWIAIRATVEWPALWLALVVVCWVTGFDIIYACQDIDVDRRLGLRSIPARLGYAGAMWVARAAHLCMGLTLLGLGLQTPELQGGYWVGAVLIGVLLIWQHWLVRRFDLTRMNIAFFQVNAWISSLLLLATVLDLIPLWLQKTGN